MLFQNLNYAVPELQRNCQFANPPYCHLKMSALLCVFVLSPEAFHSRVKTELLDNPILHMIILDLQRLHSSQLNSKIPEVYMLKVLGNGGPPSDIICLIACIVYRI